MSYFARPGTPGQPPQLLRCHLQNVGERAATFAAAAGLDPDLGRFAGLLHDLGKYSGEFQRHRLGLLPDGSPVPNFESLRVEHAAHGAWIARKLGKLDAAFAIAGHHAGLHNEHAITELDTRNELTGTQASLAGRAREFFRLAQADGAMAPTLLPELGSQEPFDFDLRTRMLFSCLLDADRLDAEGFGKGFFSELRAPVPLDATSLLDRVLTFIADRARSSTADPGLNAVRQQVLQAALQSAEHSQGLFSMTVPTGGGKTLASLAFALKHAAKYGQRRIIFVIPYLSIIEQNVDVIRDAVGDENGSLVLEHHSNISDETDEDDNSSHDGQDLASLRRRLLAENWDAPIVVTTTVQFFESLFSNRPKMARKLHNIARSVIIFDEAQTFPPGMMRPMTAMLQQLAGEPYRSSFLFCTATQPAFGVEVETGLGRFVPLIAAPIEETMPDPAGLYAALKRVEYEWPNPGQVSGVTEIATNMAQSGQALAILNTKKQARTLYRELLALDSGALHLSTRMCADHRLSLLAEIRRRLTREEPCLLASTPAIEAGVDVDFPAVWRALCPLDSIAQAAGRCNRNGLLASGKVTVFNPWDADLPPGVYAAATAITVGMLAEAPPGMDDPSIFSTFFQRLYSRRNLDENGVQKLRSGNDFPGVAKAFKIIDSETTAVLVRWGKGVELADRLLADPDAVVSPEDQHRMQRFTAGLYSGELNRAEAAGQLHHHASGVIVFTGTYDPALGLTLPDDFSEG